MASSNGGVVETIDAPRVDAALGEHAKVLDMSIAGMTAREDRHKAWGWGNTEASRAGRAVASSRCCGGQRCPILERKWRLSRPSVELIGPYCLEGQQPMSARNLYCPALMCTLRRFGPAASFFTPDQTNFSKGNATCANLRRAPSLRVA